MLLVRLLLFLLISISFTEIKGQYFNTENHSIVEYLDGSIFICELLEANGSFQPVILTNGDTLNLNLNLVKRIRRSEDIFLLNERKFHFKTGNFFDFKFGFNFGDGSGGTLIDLGYNKKIKPNLNLGIGLGLHYNSHNFSNPGSPWGWIWIDSNMIPVYVSGQYYISDKGARTFITANLGFANPVGDGWNNQLDIKGGLHGRLGFGVEFASRSKRKLFIEVYQYAQQISGSGVTFGDFGQPINYDFNLLGRRLGFAFGARF